MFKTDETVRFGQILSARTLRYGKFNEYIIIIIIRSRVLRVKTVCVDDSVPRVGRAVWHDRHREVSGARA